MKAPGSTPARDLDADALLRSLFEATAAETGEAFFQSLVRRLAHGLGTAGAWVTEYLEPHRRLRALAFWMNGDWVAEYEYDIAGTPCGAVIDRGLLIHFPDNIVELFPHDPDLPAFNAVSYMGAPLLDLDGRILGHLAVLDDRRMPQHSRLETTFRLFADRAAAELRRLRAEAAVHARERQLHSLFTGAMDAIFDLDESLCIAFANPAAERIFGSPADRFTGRRFSELLDERDRPRFEKLATTLGEGRRLWIPDGLLALRADLEPFSVEATLARFRAQTATRFAVVLRDASERLESERKMRSLEEETEYLRQELRALREFDELIGESPALLRVLQDIRQVAETDATVLINGESGTGKELVAAAIHRAGPRSRRPLVTVNCATLPPNLIESELFGHEKGAFTGATTRREGRFALAHQGTIFLDEIGELPLELQPKLLRALQQGEIKPLGGAHTRQVDVRVIAATNRDLSERLRSGEFREDLFYRLNVFPVDIPPLRERRDDIPLLAAAFAEKYARRLRREIQPLSGECIRRLSAYDWPGNVRELQNVIERGVITAREGRLNLERALPESQPASETLAPAEKPAERILTAAELRELERRNIQLALEEAGGRVSGARGAAARLGVKASTLYSRIKALGLSPPA